ANTRPGGGPMLYHNEGHGAFSAVPDSGVADSGLASGDFLQPCSADYDNDGFMDIFVGGPTSTGLFHNNGNGTFSQVTDSPVVTPPRPPGSVYPSCGFADYDNDGFLDLFVAAGCFPASPICQPLYPFLFHNSGDGTFAPVTQGELLTTSVTQTVGAVWGDYDNDGFPDLFLTEGAFWPDPQQSLLFHNDGNANGWLNVKLVGTVSNRSAVGAQVRVDAFYRGAERTQLRMVGGDGGGTNALTAAVGLADATSATVRIAWPSGMAQELHDVAPRQFLTVTEPACTNPGPARA